jgi:glutathione S-transferase
MTSYIIVAETAEQLPLAPVEGRPTLVYWNIAGIAQPIRLALILAGVEFMDVRVNAGDDPKKLDTYKSSWLRRRKEIENVLLFPDLPYYLDDKVALSQSNTILKYIGRQHGLLGPSEYVVDLVLDQLNTMELTYFRRAYSEGMEAIKVWCQEEIPPILTKWELLLGSQPFLTGDEPTVADLKLYEFLRVVKIAEQETSEAKAAENDDDTKVGGSTLLATFVKRVEELPSIKAYIECGDFLHRPLNNPHAKFK